MKRGFLVASLLAFTTVARPVILGLVTVESALAGFISLGDLPSIHPSSFSSRAHGVSADGRVVVGMSLSSFQEAFRWTLDDGIAALGDLPGGSNYSFAHGVSAAGDVVVGVSEIGGGPQRPFRWTAGDGMTDLGKLMGGNGHSRAWGVSADGNVVVGESGSAAAGLGSLEAFRWTSNAGMVGLGDLPGGSYYSRAFAVSADGSAVVGDSQISGGMTRAFRWTGDDGMADLGVLSGYVSSVAQAVSWDGSVVVGTNVGLGVTQAFGWTAATGMLGLGDLQGGSFWSAARGVSADGGLIIGASNSSKGSEAFIWDSVNGMRVLQDVLVTEYGVSIPTGWLLRDATAISPDGRYIVGFGNNPQGYSEAWLADLGPAIPEPATATMLFALSTAVSAWAVARNRTAHER